VRRHVMQLIEGIDSLAVGQEEIDQYGIYPVLLLSGATKPLYTLGAALNPLNSNGFARGAEQCRLNEHGVRGVALDEKYCL